MLLDLVLGLKGTSDLRESVLNPLFFVDFLVNFVRNLPLFVCCVAEIDQDAYQIGCSCLT